MEPVKVAAIGVGFMGSHYARIFDQTPNAELVGVTDIDPDRTARIASELGVPAFGSVEELLDGAPDAKAVLITTPESAHLKPALAAAAAGKHLLIEKPLAATVDECGQIIDSCERAGVILMVGHHSHFDPRFEELKRQIDTGSLGRLVHFYARRNLYTSSADRIQRRVSLSMWAGVHDIELMQWYLGERVRSVFARAASLSRESTQQPDAVVAILGFESGTLGTLEYSWVAPPLQGNPRRFCFDLVGTGGFAEVDYGDGGLALYTPTAATFPDMTFQPSVAGRSVGQYREQALYFLDCVQRGAKPIVTGTEAMQAVAVAVAIDRSVAELKQVSVD
jgi:UDP-N-acetylglucosamine 3-dehydrogenase